MLICGVYAVLSYKTSVTYSLRLESENVFISFTLVSFPVQIQMLSELQYTSHCDVPF